MLEEINNVLEVLINGGTILYPSDTIWGIGCDATNVYAVEKIFQIKKRRSSKSMIILVSDENMLKNYVKKIPEIVWDLLPCFERPTSVIYSDARNLAPNVIAEDKSIAIRIVKDEFCKKLITSFGKPIVSTSANVSGEPSPLMYWKISKVIIDAVDYVVKIDHDKINQMKPSMLIKLNNNGEYTIIRK